jgi:hypothetical protein
VENQEPDPEFDTHPSTSPLADLEYAASRFESICAGEPAIGHAILGLRAIASVALRGIDFLAMPPALAARFQASFFPSSRLIYESARPALLPEHVVFCLAQANSIIRPIDDGLHLDRIDCVCQLIGELTGLYHRRAIEARGSRLTKAFAIRNAAAIAADPLSPKH